MKNQKRSRNNEKGFVIFAAVSMMLLQGCGGASKEELKKNVTVEKEKWQEENVWAEYEKIGYRIKNKNDVSVDVSLTVNVYDSNGGFSHTDEFIVEAVGSGSDFFFQREYGADIERVELEDYGCKNSSGKSLKDEDLEVSTSQDGNRRIISAKNKSSETTGGCLCTLVFYDEKQKLLEAETVEMNNGKIPSGETVTEEIFCPLTYDSIQIYTKAFVW